MLVLSAALARLFQCVTDCSQPLSEKESKQNVCVCVYRWKLVAKVNCCVFFFFFYRCPAKTTEAFVFDLLSRGDEGSGLSAHMAQCLWLTTQVLFMPGANAILLFIYLRWICLSHKAHSDNSRVCVSDGERGAFILRSLYFPKWSQIWLLCQ